MSKKNSIFKVVVDKVTNEQFANLEPEKGAIIDHEGVLKKGTGTDWETIGGAAPGGATVKKELWQVCTDDNDISGGIIQPLSPNPRSVVQTEQFNSSVLQIFSGNGADSTDLTYFSLQKQDTNPQDLVYTIAQYDPLNPVGLQGSVSFSGGSGINCYLLEVLILQEDANQE